MGSRRRPTAQQQAVLDALGRDASFRSAQQLHHELAQHSPTRIGLATVYRILHKLADQHIAEPSAAKTAKPSTGFAPGPATTTT
jgi:Fur family transcriptional regulator, ferric uptake regulator